MNQTVIFGPPGTGKTTQLIKIAKDMIKKYGKNNIAIITFSRSAAKEIRDRLELPRGKVNDYIGRTIHSICKQLVGDIREVVKNKEKEKFCEENNIVFIEEPEDGDESLIKLKGEYSLGSVMFGKFDYVRINHPNNPIDYITDIEFKEQIIEKERMKELYVKWGEFKDLNNKIDFTDMLMMAYEEECKPNITCLIVDEFQDLAEIHYRLFKSWKSVCEEVYIAGDADQCIYKFQGCKPDFMLNEREGSKVIKLEKSYRLPTNIVNFTQKIIKQNINREKIDIIPFREGGQIKHLDGCGIKEIIKEFDGRTYILAPARYMVTEISEKLTKNAIPYLIINGKSMWGGDFISVVNAIKKFDKKENLPYFTGLRLATKTQNILKRGNKTKFQKMLKKPNEQILLNEDFTPNEFKKLFKIEVTTGDIIENSVYKDKKKELIYNLMKKEGKIETPNIYIGTIHSSKGTECDTTIIFLEITKRFYEDMLKDIEAIRRLYYVGTTRAKEKNVLISDYFGSPYEYDLR